jgi:hypothetical protein
MGISEAVRILSDGARHFYPVFVRESRCVHLVFADLTICEKYRWMPR